MDQKSFTPSPCTRKCTLDENEICCGCFRSINEILDWNTMPEPERKLTLERCQQRRQLRMRRK